MKEDAVIFDLDGTLFNDDHRCKIILENEGKMTDALWRQYHEACIYDEPVDIVCRCLSLLSRSMEIIIITGRDEAYRAITEDILIKHNLSYDQLIMRKNGDHRASWKVKKEVYEMYIKDDFNVIGVFEDRSSVVKVWRDLGLICLQVKESDS